MLTRPEGGREYRTIKSWTDAALVSAIRDELDGGLAMAA